MVHIMGKRGRKVPVLLTSNVSSAMELLVQKRSHCNIQQENKYFFAVPRLFSYLNPWRIMRSAALSAGCSAPHNVTSTKLRKYLATVTQVKLY